MAPWLKAALDYIPRWLAFQVRQTEQPGCVVVVAQGGEVVLEQAFGVADLATGEALTPRHRFRVASHSKSFTAAGVMRLRDAGRLRLDDHAGQFVDGLHPEIARATLGQLLSHTAGVVRDGPDCGYWSERAPFLGADALRAELRDAPVIDANTRFKYSNHAFGLAGLVIEAVTGEPYEAWIAREIVAAAGLAETSPDIGPDIGTADAPLARGHATKLPLGRRVVLSGEAPTNALAAATGFVSTAADLARFFGRLIPGAPGSPLSDAARREMTRGQWRDPHSAIERSYGLGTMSGTVEGLRWFGHAGAFPGYATRTCAVPEHDLAVSVLTNAVDGPAWPWLDGVLHILARFAEGASEAALDDWAGRWWSLWGAFDLVPLGRRVMVAIPSQLKPLEMASELEITDADQGRIALAGGYTNHGEPVRRVRDAEGSVAEIWLGGNKLVPEAVLAQELAETQDRA
jgi:CubicO group peptidase (beta-lactamase class C family)